MRHLNVTLCAALMASAAACDGGGGTEPPGALTFEVEGLLERSAVVHVIVQMDGRPLPTTEWSVTSQPADAVTRIGGDSLRLLRDGDVRLLVTAADAERTRTISVDAPPTVYFDRSVAGNRDIWRVDLDGLDLKRLTSDPGSDQDPTVARGRVVFVSFRMGSADLWSVPTAGGANTRLTSASRNETTPAISADGDRLSYAYDGGLVSKLWVSAGDGSNPVRATDGFGFSGSIESSPTWAPNGTRLAFMATPNGSADIFDFSPGGGQPTSLAPNDAADVEPAWSPDGQMVAFVSTRSGGNTDLYLLRLGTGGVTRLTTGAGTEGQPAWAPDSRRIVFTEISADARQLRWLDIEHPGRSYPVPTGEGRAENPALEP